MGIELAFIFVLIVVLAAVFVFRTHAESQQRHEALLEEERNRLPITDDPDEWELYHEDLLGGTWQNKNDLDAFSRDGGATYYLIYELRDEEGHYPLHISEVRE